MYFNHTYYTRDPRSPIPPHVMTSSAMRLNSGVFTFCRPPTRKQMKSKWTWRAPICAHARIKMAQVLESLVYIYNFNTTLCHFEQKFSYNNLSFQIFCVNQTLVKSSHFSFLSSSNLQFHLFSVVITVTLILVQDRKIIVRKTKYSGNMMQYFNTNWTSFLSLTQRITVQLFTWSVGSCLLIFNKSAC